MGNSLIEIEPEGVGGSSEPHRNNFGRYATIFQSFMATGDYLQGTFASLYAVGRGSTGLIQGAIVSIRELGTALLQPVWGHYSDIRGRRQFVVLGLLIQALAWGILMPLAYDPLHILLVIIFQTFLGTMVIPTWNGWLGDFTTRTSRGKFLGRIGIVATWMAAFVLFSISLYMQVVDPDRANVDTYSIAFRLGALFYLSSAIFALFIPQADRFSKSMIASTSIPPEVNKGPIFTRIRSVWQNLHPDFKRVLLVEASFRLAWAAAWPIFPYATLSATEGWIQLAILQIVTALASGISQLVGGALSDRLGRKRVILVSRSVLVAPPILFAVGVLQHEPIYLLISNILVGIMLGASGIALNSLILDIAPLGKESTYFSLYMMTVGLISFSASMVMGLVLNFVAPTTSPGPHLLANMLFIIAAFRFVAWFVYFFLPETMDTATG